jgi:hypothetical protein
LPQDLWIKAIALDDFVSVSECRRATTAGSPPEIACISTATLSADRVVGSHECSGCGRTFATTSYKKGGCGSATIIVSNSPALLRPSALASTRDPQSAFPPGTLWSLHHLMVATPTGHLSRQRIAVGSFSNVTFACRCSRWGRLKTDDIRCARAQPQCSISERSRSKGAQ